MIVSTIAFTYIPIHQNIQAHEFALNLDLAIKQQLINEVNFGRNKPKIIVQGVEVRVEKQEIEQYIKYCGVWLWKTKHERRVCIYDIKL